MIILSRRLLHHAVVRNTLLLYAVQFSSYVFPLIALPYLSRVLSPEKFGLVSFAQYFAWYFIILTEYGFNLTATRSLAVSHDDPEAISRLFSAVMTAKLLLTAIGFVILLLATLVVPVLRRDPALFLISFLAVVGNMLFPLWLYQGLQKMEHIAIRDFVARLVSLAALFLLVHGDGDYLLAAAAQSGAFLLAGVSGLATVPWQFKVRYRRPQWAAVREQLATGWPVFVSLAMGAVGAITNTFILGLRASGAENAYYGMALRVISAPRALVAPIATALFPHVSQKAATSEDHVIAFVRKYAVPICAPFFVGGLVLVVGAPWMVPVVLGAKYGPAVIVLQLMAFSPFLLALGHVFSTCYMLPCGYDRIWVRIMILASVVNFLVLAPGLYFLRGSVAAALAGSIAEGFSAAFYWRFYNRQSRKAAAPIEP